MAKQRINVQAEIQTFADGLAQRLAAQIMDDVATALTSKLSGLGSSVPARIGTPKVTQQRKPRRKNKNGMTKSDFIRSCSLKTPVADVIKLGAEDGLKFSAGLVYTVRSQMKTAKKAKKTKNKK